MKPLTTNASFSIADQPNFSLEDSSNQNKSGTGYPIYQLSFPPLGTEFNIDGSTSTQLVGSNLPLKVDQPHFQIYSDIVPTDLLAKGQRLNVIGIVPRTFVTGDFVYGSGSSYSQPVLFP